MDSWSAIQLKKMQAGGNGDLNAFLKKYGIEKKYRPEGQVQYTCGGGLQGEGMAGQTRHVIDTRFDHSITELHGILCRGEQSMPGPLPAPLSTRILIPRFLVETHVMTRRAISARP
jgi:hypothetical protein